MNSKVKKILKYTLSATLAVVLLYFAFRGVNWREFVSILGHCNWLLVALSMLVGFLSYVVKGLRWRVFLKPMEPETKRINCYEGITIGMLFEFVMARLGDVVRCRYVTTPKASFDKVFGTVVLDRAWDIVAMVLLSIGVLAAKWGTLGEFLKDKVFGGAAASQSISLKMWLIVAAIVVVLVLVIVLSKRVRGFIKGMWEGIKAGMGTGNNIRLMLYTIALWACYWLMLYFVALAIPETSALRWDDVLVLMLLGSFSTLIPVPGGFGAYHYVIALAVSSLYSMTFDGGIVFATLAHESQAITMLLLGFSSYIAHAVRARRQ